MLRSAKAFLLVASIGTVCLAQNATAPPATTPSAITPSTEAQSNAYYHFVMGRLYSELAQSEGNSQYIRQSLENYKEALKLDPSVSLIYDELTNLYLEIRGASDGMAFAEELLQQNPDNLNARRMLGRIYLQLASGTQRQPHTNEEYLKKALEQYQIITQKDPKDAESWVMLGTLYDASNHSSDAEKAFNTALALDPDNEDALSKMADLYAGMGDSAKAIQTLRRLTEKNPSERAYRELAQHLEEANDFKGATDALKKALELAPDDDRLERGLADALLESNQFDEALPIFEKLAQENPKEALYPMRIAMLYRLKRDLPKAQQYLDQAKKLATPEDLDVRMEEINLLSEQGKTTEAINNLKGLMESTSKRTYSPAEVQERMQWTLRLVDLETKAKQYDQALETVKQMAVLDPDPKSPRVVLTRAEVLAAQGKVDDAAADIRSLLKNDKSDRELYLRIAEIYEKGKRWNDMGKALSSAEQFSTSKEEKAQIYFMRGAMLERQKKFEASETAFRQVLDLQPDDAGALNYLGYMLADRNVKLDEAYRMIKRAVELEPDKGEYLDSLGWVFFRQGKLDEAATQLQHALDRSEDPTIHDHLGDVYLKLGKTTEAIAQWQASLREFKKSQDTDSDPEEVSKVNRKLDEAQAKLAKGTRR